MPLPLYKKLEANAAEKPSADFLETLYKSLQILRDNGQPAMFIRIIQTIRENITDLYDFDAVKKQLTLATVEGLLFRVGCPPNAHNEVYFDVDYYRKQHHFTISTDACLRLAILKSVAEICAEQKEGPMSEDILRFIKMTFGNFIKENTLHSRFMSVLQAMVFKGKLVHRKRHYYLPPAEETAEKVPEASTLSKSARRNPSPSSEAQVDTPHSPPQPNRKRQARTLSVEDAEDSDEFEELLLRQPKPVKNVVIPPKRLPLPEKPVKSPAKLPPKNPSTATERRNFSRMMSKTPMSSGVSRESSETLQRRAAYYSENSAVDNRDGSPEYPETPLLVRSESSSPSKGNICCPHCHVEITREQLRNQRRNARTQAR